MAVISGKAGTVLVGATPWLEVTKWTFEPSCAVPKYASNNTNGYKAGVAGVFDGKGTIEVKLDSSGGVDALPGASVTLVLQVDAGGTNKYTVPAIIASAPISCDIDGGEIVALTYNFEANGAWTAGGALA